MRKSKTFSWFPPWTWILLIVGGVLVFALVALILTKRRTVDVPLCEEHNNYWLTRRLLVIGCFLGICISCILGVVICVEYEGQGFNDIPLGIVLCLGAFSLSAICWPVMLLIVLSTGIRPREIVRKDITLVGVAKAFVVAYEQQEYGYVAPDLLDNLARQHWNRRRRSDEEEDDRIQPVEEDEKRGSPPDAFQEGPS